MFGIVAMADGVNDGNDGLAWPCFLRTPPALSYRTIVSVIHVVWLLYHYRELRLLFFRPGAISCPY
jgi:hypothetical protein